MKLGYEATRNNILKTPHKANEIKSKEKLNNNGLGFKKCIKDAICHQFYGLHYMMKHTQKIGVLIELMCETNLPQNLKHILMGCTSTYIMVYTYIKNVRKNVQYSLPS
jgi:hypothetical protein